MSIRAGEHPNPEPGRPASETMTLSGPPAGEAPVVRGRPSCGSVPSSARLQGGRRRFPCPRRAGNHVPDPAGSLAVGIPRLGVARIVVERDPLEGDLERAVRAGDGPQLPTGDAGAG